MQGFAVSKNRLLKAKKIESVLKDYLNKKITGLEILDIGAGNGAISSYFVDNQNIVTCVDVENHISDKRVNFVTVKTSKLPFKSDEFDIVISNHVIEHIKDQTLHLREIKRVLKKNGICYMATPNRNFPIEPHYKLPFLHYLPMNTFIKILKIIGFYKEDLFLLRYYDMTKLFNDFTVKEYTPIITKNLEDF